MNYKLDLWPITAFVLFIIIIIFDVQLKKERNKSL